MFCTNCGQQNADNSAFCRNCGASLTNPAPQPVQEQPVQYTQPGQYAQQPVQYTQPGQYAQQPVQYGQAGQYTQPAYAYDTPRKKSSAGLIMGIAAGVVLLGLLAIFFLRGGNPQALGVWYSDEYHEAMDFQEKGKVNIYTEDEDFTGSYTFNEKKGSGVISADDAKFDFRVDGKTLTVEDTRIFTKAGAGFEIQAFMQGADKPLTAKTPRPTQQPAAAASQPPLTNRPTLPPAQGETVEQAVITVPFYFGERTGTYTGMLVSGLPEGYGYFETQSDDGTSWSYEGEWKSGHFNGEGATYWANGFSEGGTYVDDELNGQGWEAWNDSLQYQGGYKNGSFDGQGALYSTYGEIVFEGKFEGGYMVESAQGRSSRVNAFKDITVPVEHEELYAACENGTNIYVEIRGQVFDVYVDPYYPGYCYIYMFNPDSNDYQITGIHYYLQKGEEPPSIDQIVTVYGSSVTLYSYSDEDLEDWTIPQVMAWSVEAE